MRIREAPAKLSNTKLSTCKDAIQLLGGNVALRPNAIYRLLGTHQAFAEFALSNQALCRQLRPHFLTKAQEPKPFGKSDLESKIDSLQSNISYKSPTDNNLLEYLANALIYKAFLLDAKDQLPKGKVDRYKREIGPQNLPKPG